MSEAAADPAAAAAFWRAAFPAPPDALPDLLDALEGALGAAAVGAVEDGADAEARTLRWRVELLFAGPAAPDAAALAAELHRRCGPFGFEPGAPALEPVAEADWLALTQAQAAPVEVGRFFLHGREGDAVPAGRVAIRVAAGLAFGSGEHGTTQACLEAVDRLVRGRPREVLDLGCGSGVLAIAAAKRWPGARALAVDNDPVAVRVAAANALGNGVGARVLARASEGWGDLELRRRRPFDLVLANVLADPLIEMAGELARGLAPGGTAVLSGFVAADADRVAAAHRDRGLRAVARLDRGPWSALLLERPGRGRRARGPAARR